MLSPRRRLSAARPRPSGRSLLLRLAPLRTPTDKEADPDADIDDTHASDGDGDDDDVDEGGVLTSPGGAAAAPLLDWQSPGRARGDSGALPLSATRRRRLARREPRRSTASGLTAHCPPAQPRSSRDDCMSAACQFLDVLATCASRGRAVLQLQAVRCVARAAVEVCSARRSVVRRRSDSARLAAVRATVLRQDTPQTSSTSRLLRATHTKTRRLVPVPTGETNGL